MRDADRRTGELFSYVDLESRVQADHPDSAGLYSRGGRPGIPPERLEFDLLFRWFGLAQVELRGLARVDFAFVLCPAAYNLVRLPKLLAGASP